jgi:hypothetical protein
VALLWNGSRERESRAGREGRRGRLARAGQKRGVGPLKEEKHFSNFIFNEFFKYQILNTILSNKMTFS